MAYSGELQAGTKIGNLLIERQLRVDGCGEVYTALIQPPGIRALVRVLSPQLSVPGPGLQQLLGKLQKYANCRNPHLAQMAPLNQMADLKRWLIVTSVGNANSLAERVAQKNLTAPAVVAIMKQALTGMQFAHSNGFIHGDVNLENIVIGVDGKVKLLNFAFAGVSLADRQASLEFQAPEILSTAQPTMGSDIFALGIVFNKLFQAVGNGRFPVGIRRVAEKMSTRDLANRFTSMAGALQMLGVGFTEDAFEDAQKIISRNYENTRTIQIQVDREIRRAETRSRIPLLVSLLILLVLGYAGFKKYSPLLMGKNIGELSTTITTQAVQLGKTVTGIEKLEAAKKLVIDTKDAANEETKRKLASAEAASEGNAVLNEEPKREQ